MPRKTSTRTFLENQLRIFIASRPPKPHTKLRAMQTLIALMEFPQVAPKNVEPELPEEHANPVDDKIQKMLDQNRKIGGANADKLSQSSS